MRNKFHIVIDEKAFKEGYFALCAELYGPKGEGATPEEAEAGLVRSIKLFLEGRREEGLRDMPPEASLTIVTVDEARQAKAIRFDEDQIIERAKQIIEARKKEAAGSPPPWKGTMHNEFTAIIKPYTEDGEERYLATCPEVGGLGGGKTIDGALDDLAEACALMLLVQREGEMRSALPEAIHKTITVSVPETASVA